MRRKNIALTASAGIAAGALGLTSLALPAGAQDPNLPRTTPEGLVSSVLDAEAPAMAGTVTVDNDLGLPALPGTGDSGEFLSAGEQSLRVWSDGQRAHRMSVQKDNGEITVVDDGDTVWKWDSSERTVVEHPDVRQRAEAEGSGADPAELSRHIVGKLRDSSSVTVDGTTSVAGRDAYELVLTPKPGERTKLREVRIAVDAEHRIPLRVEVEANGSAEPALRAGFSRIDFGSQDPGLFRFTPPDDARVRTEDPHGDAERHGRAQQDAEGPEPRTTGEGWDTVVTARIPAEAVRGAQEDSRGGKSERNLRAVLERSGDPVNGSWGHGWAVDTSVGSAVITSDGRVVTGAVPRQVLIEALKEA
ncbi:outer membrane lipoprotein-sorting protein [Actinopolyspora biskrensis]|uniref:Outer membrane lipoprotein-sorting protein n=1 Tax=Actinopolyspora biskrensis TaxID=1470178 RepID=A0A852Z2X5_9ACTN|nr:outer membrane lipoprotein carrier protein LolA [Actinopolyspora biskrensis]NYH80119.1 outer membrane lipoprotein-sorting protein [Actinopolyspora biskrensis]